MKDSYKESIHNQSTDFQATGIICSKASWNTEIASPVMKKNIQVGILHKLTSPLNVFSYTQAGTHTYAHR